MSSTKATHVVQRYDDATGTWTDIDGATYSGAKAGQKAAKATAGENPELIFRCAAVYAPIRAKKKVTYEFETPELSNNSAGELDSEPVKKPKSEPESENMQEEKGESKPEPGSAEGESKPEKPESASDDNEGEPEKIQDAPGESEAEDKDESTTMFSALFDGSGGESGSDGPPKSDELF